MDLSLLRPKYGQIVGQTEIASFSKGKGLGEGIFLNPILEEFGSENLAILVDQSFINSSKKKHQYNKKAASTMKDLPTNLG